MTGGYRILRSALVGVAVGLLLVGAERQFRENWDWRYTVGGVLLLVGVLVGRRWWTEHRKEEEGEVPS